MDSQPSMQSQLPPLPSTPTKQTKLTQDQRLKAETLRDIGWKYQQIADYLHCTLRQVQYACNSWLTPQKRQCGRKYMLDVLSREYIAWCVCQSPEIGNVLIS
jgi:hypothetical protein